MWTDETKVNLYQNDRRRAGTAHDLLMVQTFIAVNGTDSFVFIDGEAVVKCSKMNSKVQGYVICSDLAKCFKSHWTASQYRRTNML